MSIAELPSPRTHQPSRRPGYKPTYKQRSLAGENTASLVPTHLVATELERVLPRLDKECSNVLGPEDRGGLYLLARRAALMLSMPKFGVVVTEAATVRRLYDIRGHIGRCTNAHLADGLLLAAGVDIERDTDIPTVPGGIGAAFEKIDIHCEQRRVKLSPGLRKELALDLIEWSRLVIHDGYEALLAGREELAE